MIHFTTDIQPGEPHLLSPLLNHPLHVISLDGKLLAIFDAPRHGWTQQSLETKAREIATITELGAIAFLGPTLVGSTDP